MEKVHVAYVIRAESFGMVLSVYAGSDNIFWKTFFSSDFLNSFLLALAQYKAK